jgi:hypothetical protein
MLTALSIIEGAEETSRESWESWAPLAASCPERESRSFALLRMTILFGDDDSFWDDNALCDNNPWDDNFPGLLNRSISLVSVSL